MNRRLPDMSSCYETSISNLEPYILSPYVEDRRLIRQQSSTYLAGLQPFNEIKAWVLLSLTNRDHTWLPRFSASDKNGHQ